MSESAVPAARPIQGFDPHDAATRTDPFPTYRWLRANAPVYRLPGLPMWVLSRYADVERVFRDHETFASDPGGRRRGMSLVTMDPPDHGRVRQTVARAFTWRRVQHLAPRIERLCETLLDESAGRCELVDAFANPLPVIVVCELLGVPTEQRKDMRRWSRDALRATVPTGGATPTPEQQQAGRGVLELREFLAGQLRARRTDPRDDLLTGLVELEAEGVISEQELEDFCALLLIAGHETTTNLIGNGAGVLAEDPGLFAALRREPARVPAFVEEVLRYASPLQRLVRRATRDVELCGERIPAGGLLMLLVGSANRDEARWPEPDRFDIERDTSGHLAFGLGMHSCMGASLARLEGRIAFETLLRRVSRLALDPDDLPSRITSYGAGPFGWDRLPLRLDVA